MRNKYFNFFFLIIYFLPGVFKFYKIYVLADIYFLLQNQSVEGITSFPLYKKGVKLAGSASLINQ